MTRTTAVPGTDPACAISTLRAGSDAVAVTTGVSPALRTKLYWSTPGLRTDLPSTLRLPGVSSGITFTAKDPLATVPL